MAQLLCERWTLGESALAAPLVPPETLGGAFSDPAAHLATIEHLLDSAEGFSSVALAYRGSLGPALEAVLAKRRPVLSRRELAVPYPTGGRTRVVAEGLIVAGTAIGGAIVRVNEPGSARGPIE